MYMNPYKSKLQLFNWYKKNFLLLKIISKIKRLNYSCLLSPCIQNFRNIIG